MKIYEINYKMKLSLLIPAISAKITIKTTLLSFLTAKNNCSAVFNINTAEWTSS